MTACDPSCWGSWCPGVAVSAGIGVGIALVIMAVAWVVAWLIWGRW